MRGKKGVKNRKKMSQSFFFFFLLLDVTPPQFASAVLTAKAAFMEVLFVCHQRLHGVHPLPAHPAQFGLWYSSFLQRDEFLQL